MEACPGEDLKSDIKSFDLEQDQLPVQRSLGISWNLKDDTFVFNVMIENKPFTRRGLLSIVNSIYDPLDYIAPITISGKILLREITPSSIDWDDPLPDTNFQTWNRWKESLLNLQEVAIPHKYVPISMTKATSIAIYIFSDASEKAISAVSYIKLWDSMGMSKVGFLFGKARLAPAKGHTIPRLELCGAVLATEVAEIVSVALDVPISNMKFFTDSKVVLGYICNSKRRIFTYVSNRVEKF